MRSSQKAKNNLYITTAICIFLFAVCAHFSAGRLERSGVRGPNVYF